MSKYEDTVLAFTRFIGQATKRDVETQRALSAVVVWQSTAQHIRELAVVLAIENKPLFGAFNTRQVEAFLKVELRSFSVTASLRWLGSRWLLPTRCRPSTNLLFESSTFCSRRLRLKLARGRTRLRRCKRSTRAHRLRRPAPPQLSRVRALKDFPRRRG